MTEKRYDDELLSAIIDGEATPESVASVESDPGAQERLAMMRSGIELVSTPVPDATTERRSQSIAAAMAAATPAAPEVTSLAAQRHKREEKTPKGSTRGMPPGWMIAVAAAMLLFVLAIPFVFNTGVTDTATDATAGDSTEDQAAEETSDDTSDEVEEAMEDDEPADAEPAEEAAMDDDEEAMEDSADGEEENVDADDGGQDFVNLDVQVVPSVAELDLLIADDTISPQLAGDDILALEPSVALSGNVSSEVLATEVNPACVEPDETATNPTPYSIVVLDPFAGPASLVIVEFADDGMRRLLDAETCVVLG